MAMGLNLGVSWEHGIGVGTRGAPGARAPPSFQSVPYISCTTNEILHTVPPQS